MRHPALGNIMKTNHVYKNKKDIGVEEDNIKNPLNNRVGKIKALQVIEKLFRYIDN